MNKRQRGKQIRFYKKVLAVQEIYQKHERLMNNEVIYTEFIFPAYYISRSTFYDYLSTNAKAKLKELDNEKSN